MVSKKDRRHRGWVIPQVVIKEKKKVLIDNCLEPQPFYDNWVDCRDSMRNWFGDKSKLKKKSIVKKGEDFFGITWLRKNNYKLKRLLKRREAMKRNDIKASKLYL